MGKLKSETPPRRHANTTALPLPARRPQDAGPLLALITHRAEPTRSLRVHQRESRTRRHAAQRIQDANTTAFQRETPALPLPARRPQDAGPLLAPITRRATAAPSLRVLHFETRIRRHPAERIQDADTASFPRETPSLPPPARRLPDASPLITRRSAAARRPRVQQLEAARG